MPYTLPRSGHVRLHRLWAFTNEKAELTLAEHVHILYCEECQAAIFICLQEETFGSVLTKLSREDDDSKAG